MGKFNKTLVVLLAVGVLGFLVCSRWVGQRVRNLSTFPEEHFQSDFRTLIKYSKKEKDFQKTRELLGSFSQKPKIWQSPPIQRDSQDISRITNFLK